MRRHWGWFCLVWLATAATEATVIEHRYSVELFDRQSSVFEIPIDIQYAGDLEIVADWDGNRRLAFRLDAQDGVTPSIRKTGPPPLRLKVPVSTSSIGEASWTLTIRSLPMSGASRGIVTIRPPRDPRLLALEEKTTRRERERAAQPTLAPWELPRRLPPTVTPKAEALVQSAEHLRGWLVNDDLRMPDSCRWQDELMRWSAKQRDLYLDEQISIDEPTSKLLDRIAKVIADVDQLSDSRDPAIVGPMPGERDARTTWLRKRASKLSGTKGELDFIMQSIQRDYAPDLSGESWPLRMISCLMASERYYEQRWLVGDTEAMNRELAEAQAEPLNRAQPLLRAIAATAAEEPIRLLKRRR